MRQSRMLGFVIVFAGCGQSAPTVVHDQPVEHWIQALHDPNAAVRKKAVKTLGNAGPVDPAVVPALAGAVQDRDVEVRREAVLALMKAGPAANEAIPALSKAQSDKDSKVRTYARQALVKIQGND